MTNLATRIENNSVDNSDIAIYFGWTKVDTWFRNANGCSEGCHVWLAPGQSLEEFRKENNLNDDQWGDDWPEYPKYLDSMNAAIDLLEAKLPGWPCEWTMIPGELMTVNLYNPEDNMNLLPRAKGTTENCLPTALVAAIIRALEE